MTMTGRTTVEPSMRRQLMLSGREPKATPIMLPSIMPKAVQTWAILVSDKGVVVGDGILPAIA